MSIEQTVLALRGSEDPLAWEALRAGIGEADPRIQAAVLETLLTFRDKETPRLVIEQLDRLGEEALAILRKEGADPLRSYIRANLERLSGKQRENAMRFMSLTGSADTLDMLLLGLDAPEPEERRRSAEAILDAVQKYAIDLDLEGDRLSDRRVQNRRRAQVLRCLERALELYPRHRQQLIVDAVLALGSHGYPLLNQVLLQTARPRRRARPAVAEAAPAPVRDEDEEQPEFLRQARQRATADTPPPDVEPKPAEAPPEPQVDPRRLLILEALRTRTGPQAMEFLVQLAIDPELHGVASQIIDLRQEEPEFRAALACAVVGLELKEFNFLLSRCGDYPWTQWVVDLASGLVPDDALNAMRFVLRGSNPVKQKGKWLEALFANPSDRVRMQVLNQFEGLDPEQGWRILVRALHDREHPEIQLQAVDLALEHRKAAPLPIGKLLAPLLSGGEGAVAQRVAAALAKLGLEGYMQAYHKMSPQTRERAARVLAKLQPDVRQTVLSELSDLQSDKKVVCLEFLKTLGEERSAADLMQQLMSDHDNRVRATAVNILGAYGTIESIKILLQALQDPDRRVQANVIEALEAVPAPGRVAKLLLPYLEHPDNRIRGNAVKALWNLGFRDTTDVVEGMLAHGERNMRLSGIWLVGELGLGQCQGRLQLLAARDREEPVRSKAAEVLARMIARKER